MAGSKRLPPERREADATVLPPEPTPEPGAAPPGDGRLRFLDSVRALSALYVVAHHLFLAVYHGYPANTGPAVLAPLLYGQFGVAVFIVVSGFSLALAPVRHDHELTGGFGRFIRRRAWRIIPPYWAALALSVAIVGGLVNLRIEHPLTVRGVLTHLFLVQDVVDGASPNGAFWSIAVEWQLYFAFPLFLLVRRRLGAALLGASVVGVVAAVKVAEGHSAAADKLLHLSPQFAALFVFGIVAAEVTNRSPGPERRPGTGRWGWAATASAVVVVVVAGWMGTERSIDNLYWLDLVVGFSMACGLAHLAGRRDGRARRTLERAPLVAIGRYSYSLYLIHAPLLLVAWLFVVEPLGLPSNAAFAVMVLVVAPVILASSYGFHLGVERPFLTHRSVAALMGSFSGRTPDPATTPPRP